MSEYTLSDGVATKITESTDPNKAMVDVDVSALTENTGPLATDSVLVQTGTSAPKKATITNFLPKFVSDDGLVLALSFQDRSINGTTVYDASSYKNDGTASGSPTFTATGGFNEGGFVTLDGVDDYIQIPHSTQLSLLGKHTISFWLKMAATVPGEVVLLSKSIPSYAGGWTVTANTSYLSYTLYDSDSTQSYTRTGVSWINSFVGIWKHYAFVCESAGAVGAGEMKIYIDGVMLATTTYNTGQTPLANTEVVRIGANTGATAPRYLPGSMDDVRLYNRALSASEIRSLFLTKQEVPPPCSWRSYP